MSGDVLRVGDLTRVRVGPVVHLSILDQFLRQQPSAGKRVYGVLVGDYVMNTLEVTACFAVPVTETEEELAIDRQQLQLMKTLHEQANPSEKIVGWYAAGNEAPGEWTSNLQESFEEVTDVPDLMYLYLDTSFPDGELNIKTFQPADCTLQLDADDEEEEEEQQERTMLYTRVPCEVLAFSEDRVALTTLNRSLSSTRHVTPLQTKLEGVMQSTDKLLTMVDKALDYVTQVVEGKKEGDARIGRYLKESLAAAPKVDPSSMLHDLLLVVYLTQLTKSQLALHEKLQTVL